MERALNLEDLRLALGDGGMFPSAEDLQHRLAQAEIALFLQRGAIDDELLATAWYLHAVGSARVALALYPVDRQRRANQVAAHIFDLALSAGMASDLERRETTFAAQVSYLRGDLDPNAIALYRRLPHSEPRLVDAPGAVSLDVGSSVLALDRRRVFDRVDALRLEAGELRRIVGVDDLIQTPYGSAARVVEGCRELIVHLTYNRPGLLERARQLFDEGANPPYAQADLNSRWVAAHLRDIADDLGTTSVWAYLPPTVPRGAGMAMTMGDPPVLSLWPPQLDLLRATPNPLDPSVRRLVLSFPTSAGKTLIAQYIVSAHVVSGRGAACVVVPTHSLGREVQRDLDRRLATLAADARDAGPLGVPLPDTPSVVVMTPEKLAAHLRTEPERILRDYSLFVIDEAHLVGDADRGWVLESALGFLHAATVASHHRIVLLSAALGNRTHVAAWMGVNGIPALSFHHEWRGPRRAHALFRTDADWNNAKIIEPSGRRVLYRKRVPLHGQIHVRTSPGGYESLRTTEPVGHLVQVWRNGVWEKHDDSDPAYAMRARTATVLGAHGSVLIIEATKRQAQYTAAAVAAELEDDPQCAALVALAVTRLGQAHPLVAVLRKGVGFHHAALPDDIQAELEDGIRKGPLQYLVATTTLVEGINFPVRSVLVGDRGYRDGDDYVTTLDARKLLNAMGRAGRAARETEGWIVLSFHKQFSPTDFGEFAADEEELSARSRLGTAEALEALAAFEELLRRSEDAIMGTYDGPAADFIGHVWFVANALSELGLLYDPSRVSLESTLAWRQLDEVTRTRWQWVAYWAARRFAETPPDRRRRWARTGTSLPSAMLLEWLAQQVRAELPLLDDRQDPVTSFRLIAAHGRLAQLLSIDKPRAALFRARRNAPRTESITLDLEVLIVDWLRGREVGTIGDTHLATVAEETYRYEQLSEFITQVLEHLLPWHLNTLVEWINDGLDPDDQLCPELPAYIRFGVDTPVALELARAGVRSRRLVHVIADVAAHATTASVRQWLREGDVRSWRRDFEASPTELADLLVVTRARDARVTSRVLAGEVVEVPLVIEGNPATGVAELRELEEGPPAPIAAVQDGEVVGYVPPGYHDDVALLRTIGIPLVVELSQDMLLRIHIDDPTERGAWFGGGAS